MAPSLEIRPADLNMFLHGTGGVNQKQYLWIRYKIPVGKWCISKTRADREKLSTANMIYVKFYVKNAHFVS